MPVAALVPLTEYSPAELGVSVALDGPCLLPDGTFALFVSLRGEWPNIGF